MIVLSGNTVKLEAEFFDWNNKLTDPESVTTIIYNSAAVKIEELTPQNTAVGKYMVLYTVPEAGYYTFEFKGMIEGKPYLNRQSFQVKFKV